MLAALALAFAICKHIIEAHSQTIHVRSTIDGAIYHRLYPRKTQGISFTGISNINSGIACCVALLYFGNIKRYGKYNSHDFCGNKNV